MYVTGFYLLKVLFFKKVSIIIQNPIFGNDRGARQIPQTMSSILCAQFAAYTVCQILMINFTTSQCTDEGRSAYDRSSPYVCHDQFDSTDIWFALSAISADFALFASFANRWNGILSVLMEEVGPSIFIQFSLVVVGMISCTMNAVYHYSLLLTSNKVSEFDSFQGTGYFCLDCAVMATLLVAGLADCRIYFAKKLNIKPMLDYFHMLDESEYAYSLLA